MDRIVEFLAGLTLTNWIAIAALTVSLAHVAWQVRQKRRERRPDLAIHSVEWMPGPRHVPGERIRGQHGDYRVGRFRVEGVPNQPTMVVRVGLAPIWRIWRRFLRSEVTESRLQVPYGDVKKLPVSTGNATEFYMSVIPTGDPPWWVKPEQGARVWVQTSSRHYVYSRHVVPFAAIERER